MREKKVRTKWPGTWIELSGNLRLATLVRAVSRHGWRVQWSHRIGAIEVFPVGEK